MDKNYGVAWNEQSRNRFDVMGNIFQTKDKNEIFPLNGCYTFNYISAANY